jgi:hypothetical protein
LEPEISYRSIEYTRRSADLDDRVRILKQQVITAMDQAEKSSVVSKNVPLLEEQVSASKSKIT